MLTLWRRGFGMMTRSPFGASVLSIAGLLLWLLAVHEAVFSRMGQLGLVSILGWAYFVGLTIVVLGFTNELLRTPLRSRWLITFLVLIAVYLFGTACAVEPIASLADSYRHAGLLQFIFQNGYALPHYVADFSWPGAFSMGSLFVSFAGQTSALPFTRWFPLFIELMYLPPLIVISRSIGVGRRAGWLGIALFFATDWIYQDYFSPQALAYLYMLVVLAAVFAVWRPKPSVLFSGIRSNGHERLARSKSALHLGRLRDRESSKIRSPRQTAMAMLGPWRPKPQPPLYATKKESEGRFLRYYVVSFLHRLMGRDSESVVGRPQTLAIFFLIALIAFAMAMSHELTPYALILMLGACLLGRRLGRPEVLGLAILFTVGWLSLGASDYWLGHLSNIFGGVGQISSTISANVNSRVSGSVVHKLAVETRILIILALYLLAGIGVLRRATNSRVLEIICLAPFFLLGLSSYVGEGLIRVVLYALPFTALLAASAYLPQRTGEIRPWMPNFRFARYGRHSRVTLWWLVFVTVLASVLITTVARGGNDDYESYSKGELAASNYVYDHVSKGATVSTVAPYLPFDQRGVGSVYWVAVSLTGSPSVKGILRGLYKTDPQFIVLSQSQENWGEIVAGLPKGWENSVFDYLVTNGFHVVKAWPTASVLKVDAKDRFKF